MTLDELIARLTALRDGKLGGALADRPVPGDTNVYVVDDEGYRRDPNPGVDPFGGVVL